MSIPAPPVKNARKSRNEQHEIGELKKKLAEAEETIRAIQRGEVDAVVIDGDGAPGPRVFTLLNADRPYRNIVERMQEGALTMTRDGTVLYANRRLESFLGFATPSVVSKNFRQFIVADDRGLFDRLLSQDGQTGTNGELTLQAEDGSVVPVFLSLVDLTNEDQEIVAGIVTDLRWQKRRMRELAEVNATLVAAMEENKQAEAALRQMQKMEAVGNIAAGIAHDFNNLLAVIVTNLELVQKQTNDEKLKHRVDGMLDAIGRGAQLIKRLLAFSHAQELQPGPVFINAFLHDMEPILSSSAGGAIRLTLALGDDTAQCLVDAGELQSSILNLVVNAKDAMPDGGSLLITTTAVELNDNIDDRTGAINPGRYLAIIVADTGQGMSPETLGRAFDPYFTTKELGKGTGLGLSQVFGFMRQSGGYATIDSTAGVGTSVRLYLPRIEASDVSLAQEGAVAAAASLPNGPRILVVEDDPGLRGVVVEALEELGYIVVAADTGPTALALLDNGAAFDIILSDVILPDGMSGFQLADEIRHRSPSLPVVLTSGMTDRSGATRDARAPVPILRKPYKIEDLSRALEAALDPPPRGADAVDILTCQ